MTEKLKIKPRSVKGLRKKNVAVCSCNEDCYCSFALLRNDGILPLKTAKGVAVVECRKSKSIASSQVLYKSLLKSNDQVIHVSHILGQKSIKKTIKETVKKLKRYPVTVLYVRNEAKNELAEIEQLVHLIKKHSTLVLCYHKTGSLISSTLISYANAVFACFNKDKDEAKALCNLLLGASSPYARVNIKASAPFKYEYLVNKPKCEYSFMGYGLSYVNFSYTNVTLSHYTAKIGEKIEVLATITNNSAFSTCEFPQLYVSSVGGYSPSLIDFGKVSVSAGESAMVAFKIDTSMLNYNNLDNVDICSFYACVGKSSTDVVRIPFRVMF